MFALKQNDGLLQIDINISETHDRVSISNEDIGVGIQSNIKEKILDTFFSRKKVGEGTGLGLSISYGIINDHGGNIIHDENFLSTIFVIFFLKNREAGKGRITVLR